jgi:hypothetical protein
MSDGKGNGNTERVGQEIHVLYLNFFIDKFYKLLYYYFVMKEKISIYKKYQILAFMIM